MYGKKHLKLHQHQNVYFKNKLCMLTLNIQSNIDMLMLSSPLVFSVVHVAQSLVFCVMFCRSLLVLFLLVIASSVLLRCMASDYPFGIFKLFFERASDFT